LAFYIIKTCDTQTGKIWRNTYQLNELVVNYLEHTIELQAIFENQNHASSGQICVGFLNDPIFGLFFKFPAGLDNFIHKRL
jgi:hypothetical protein